MGINCKLTCILLVLVNVHSVVGQEGGSDDNSNALITLAVLCGALLISLVIAKLVDHCYDRSTLRDDASDISEHTRKLIRWRLAVIKIPKKEKKKPVTSTQRASRVLRIWSAKSKRRQSQLAVIQNKSDVVINVEEVSKDAKNPLKLAFIPVSPVISGVAANIDEDKPVTLKIPIDELLQLQSAEDDVVKETPVIMLTANTSIDSPKQETHAVQSKSNAQPTVTKPTTQETTVPKLSTSKNKDEPKQRAISAKTVNDNNSSASTRNNQSDGATKTVPKNPTKSSTPQAMPKFFPLSPKPVPLNKAKSVPYMSSKVAPQVKDSPSVESKTAFRSPSPPKILIQQATESDFLPKLTHNPTNNLKAAFEKDTKGASDEDSRPTSFKMPRAVSAQSGKIQSTKMDKAVTSGSLQSSDKLAKKAVHFQTRKSNSSMGQTQ